MSRIQDTIWCARLQLCLLVVGKELEEDGRDLAARTYWQFEESFGRLA